VTYKLFLDDLRAPPDGSWTVARSVPAAVQHISTYGLPLKMSLDHDLGDGIDAPVLLHWLVDRYLDGEPMQGLSEMEIHVHSANPVGHANLMWFWKNFTFRCLVDHTK